MRIRAKGGGPDDTLDDMASEAAGARKFLFGMSIVGLVGSFLLDLNFGFVFFGGALGLAQGTLGRLSKRIRAYEGRQPS